MIINANAKAINTFNEKFAGFHDAYIVNFQLLSGVKPMQQLPWENEKLDFKDNTEKLESTHYSSFSAPQGRMLILDNLYDWPHQPPNRTIEFIFSKISDFSPKLLSFVGTHIFDLSCTLLDKRITFNYTYHDPGLEINSMDNGHTEKLFTCERFRFSESLFSK